MPDAFTETHRVTEDHLARLRSAYGRLADHLLELTTALQPLLEHAESFRRYDRRAAKSAARSRRNTAAGPRRRKHGRATR